MKMVDDEQINLNALGQQGQSARAAAALGSSYLDYLHSTWMTECIWQGWSQKGRVVAATRLQIPVEGVLPTTNHLESFNGLLKRKYIPRWQHSGARLRFDFLIHILIAKILPEIYSLRRSQHHYALWLTTRFHDSAGGSNLNQRSALNTSTPSRPKPLYWYEADRRRDDEAIIIINTRRLSGVEVTNPPESVTATCAASSASLQDPNHARYALFMHRMGTAHCECSDYMYRGAACKHLRALRFVVNAWVKKGDLPTFYHPTSRHDAERVNSSTSQPPSDPSIDTTQRTALLLNNLLALRQLARNELESTGGLGVDECSEASGVDECSEASGVDECSEISSDEADGDVYGNSSPEDIGPAINASDICFL
jgi:hypothetical protein